MKRSRHSKGTVFATLLVCAFFLPGTALATSVLGGSVIVQNNGNVTATFQGSNAGYISSLYLGDTKIFTSNQAAGTTFDLGSFSAGTELTFRLEVHNTGHTFYSGSAANNVDGIAHALVNDSWGNNETLVSFEDLLGGGDQDYNDLIFSFTNTETEATGDPTAGGTGGSGSSGSDDHGTVVNPEPSTVILLGSGIVGLAAWRWRKGKTEV